MTNFDFTTQNFEIFTHAIILLFFLWSLIHYLYLYVASKKWLSVSGVIESHNYLAGNGDLFSKNRLVKVKLCYRYEVNGNSYRNSKLELVDLLWLPPLLTSRSFLKHLSRKKVGDVINVYYQADEPSRSCVDIRLEKRVVLFSVIMIFFFSFIVLWNLYMK